MHLEKGESPNAVLRWTCESCGWSVLVPMPGYAGDGHRHYRGDVGCGPLVARREGFLRAEPGISSDELDRMAGEESRCRNCDGTGRVVYHGTGDYAELRACSVCSDGRTIAPTTIPNVRADA